MIITDTWFLAAAIPAVILVGLSKGGLGGAMGFVGVPLMALAISPVQAAAILLPILILMDLVSLWTWRGKYDRKLLFSLLPASIFGLGLGWLTAAYTNDSAVRLIVGAVAVIFVSRAVWNQFRHGEIRKAEPNAVAANFWGTITGYTSFVAHVGGPPFQVYTLPLKLDPKVFTGTSVIFFAAMNFLKLIPYFALGQFDSTNLLTSFALMPLAPLATLAGAWVVRRLRPEIFYFVSYGTVGLIAIKLVYDEIVALL